MSGTLSIELSAGAWCRRVGGLRLRRSGGAGAGLGVAVRWPAPRRQPGLALRRHEFHANDAQRNRGPAGAEHDRQAREHGEDGDPHGAAVSRGLDLGWRLGQRHSRARRKAERRRLVQLEVRRIPGGVAGRQISPRQTPGRHQRRVFRGPVFRGPAIVGLVFLGGILTVVVGLAAILPLLDCVRLLPTGFVAVVNVVLVCVDVLIEVVGFRFGSGSGSGLNSPGTLRAMRHSSQPRHHTPASGSTTPLSAACASAAKV